MHFMNDLQAQDNSQEIPPRTPFTISLEEWNVMAREVGLPGHTSGPVDINGVPTYSVVGRLLGDQPEQPQRLDTRTLNVSIFIFSLHSNRAN